MARGYEARGYEVLSRNWRCADGELDLVLGRDDEIVFCEVKTRTSSRFGTPGEAVGRAKRRRIRGLAVAWLEANGRSGRLRFDVASVLAGRVDLIENAF